MISRSTSEKKRMTLIFSAFYFFSAIFLVLIFTILWNTDNRDGIGRNGKTKLSGDEQLDQLDMHLQEKLNNLQAMDRKFAAVLVDSGVKANFDTIFNRKMQEEMIFKKSIDSVSAMNVSGGMLGKFNQLISSYKSALESRKPLDDMQQSIVQGSKQMQGDQQLVWKLKADLIKKDSSIAQLSEQLRSGSDRRDRYSASFPTTDYNLLKNENKYLKSEIKLMEAKMDNQRPTKTVAGDDDKTFVNAQLKTSPKTSTTSKN